MSPYLQRLSESPTEKCLHLNEMSLFLPVLTSIRLYLKFFFCWRTALWLQYTRGPSLKTSNVTWKALFLFITLNCKHRENAINCIEKCNSVSLENGYVFCHLHGVYFLFCLSVWQNFGLFKQAILIEMFSLELLCTL